MEYHQDRFDDNSLLIYKNEKLIAVFSANKKGSMLYSHQGLSYGGLMFQRKVSFKDALQSFRELLNYTSSEGFITVTRACGSETAV